VEALRNLGKETRCFGVYSAAYDAAQFKPHIELLKTHAHSGLYNRQNPEDQYAFRQIMIEAVQRSDPPFSAVPR
jgi:hypothetical protein